MNLADSVYHATNFIYFMKDTQGRENSHFFVTTKAQECLPRSPDQQITQVAFSNRDFSVLYFFFSLSL